jgi:hypothetical protein
MTPAPMTPNVIPSATTGVFLDAECFDMMISPRPAFTREGALRRIHFVSLLWSILSILIRIQGRDLETIE